jgi:hypothetical protein
MTGDAQARFCNLCGKSVYNLSAMTEDEAEALVRERTQDTCVRLYRRADGTVLTSDCSVGSEERRRRRITTATVLSATMASVAVVFSPPPFLKLQEDPPIALRDSGPLHVDPIPVPMPRIVAQGRIVLAPHSTTMGCLCAPGDPLCNGLNDP